MDQAQFNEIRGDIRDLRNDIKNLLPVVQMVERHEMLLYGNGQPGLLATVEEAKARHKVYNKLFAAIAAVVTFITGNVVWRWMGGRA